MILRSFMSTMARGSVEPLLSWVSSIAPSNMLAKTPRSLTKGRNSILLGTLRGQSLHRVLIAGNRVMLDERIAVNFWVRDLTWVGSTLVCLSDVGYIHGLVFLDRETK